MSLICSDLEAKLRIDLVSEESEAPACPFSRNKFRWVLSMDIDRVLGDVRPTTCTLDQGSSWLLSVLGEGIGAMGYYH